MRIDTTFMARDLQPVTAKDGEDKVSLVRRRAELVESLAAPLSAEDRVRIQGELSVINAKIKSLNTIAAVQLKAAADQKKAAGLAEAQSNAARARAKRVSGGGDDDDDDDDDPGQTAAIDAWIVAVLQREGVKMQRAEHGAFVILDAPVSGEAAIVRAKWVAIVRSLRDGIHAAARGQELPLLWDGMCPAGKHGLDFEGQPCDLCKQQRHVGVVDEDVKLVEGLDRVAAASMKKTKKTSKARKRT